MAVVIGKRYRFPPPPLEVGGEEKPPDVDHVEVLVIKPGDCMLRLGDDAMVEIQPKVLPSAD